MSDRYELIKEISNALNELGVPDSNYPTPIANAVLHLKKAFELAEKCCLEIVKLERLVQQHQTRVNTPSKPMLPGDKT
jgi:hypothetical protein